MATFSLSGIEITDGDIDEIEQLFGDVSFDEQRRRIIKNMSTFDVQAFPGSGKTTVLIAKLAVLAKKWPYEHKGICILSHTNVARTEIQKRLGQTEIGTKLLSYPHFIGTVHSFCDTFISLPWLRSNGYSVSMIDTDVVLNLRWRKLKKGSKHYLQKNKGIKACESNGFPVSVDVGCGSHTETYRNVKEVVDKSFKAGYYTFDEMLYVAQYVIKQYSSILSNAIQKRFPLLFIDEAQDTSCLQWDLIRGSFNSHSISIQQAFGDANQAIFQSYNNEGIEQGIFPNAEPLTISNSHRFGKGIAKLAESLALCQRGLVGDSTEYANSDDQHTIFLFDKHTSKALIQAYAKHILDCFSDDKLNPSNGLKCYVVGMVHSTEKEPYNSKRLPVGIRDYLDEYDPNLAKVNHRSEYLIDYFHVESGEGIPSNNLHPLLDSISDAIRWFINKKKRIVPHGGRAFNALLQSVCTEKVADFRKAMLKLIQMPFSSESEWDEVASVCKRIIYEFYGIEDTNTNFFSWRSGLEAYEGGKAKMSGDKRNVYVYTDKKTGRQVTIHFGSIHSVKGQTHLCTMTVETYWYGHNISRILPWLCNEPQNNPGQRDSKRLKSHYVALTRARGLICLGIPRDHITEKQIGALQDNGWRVEVV